LDWKARMLLMLYAITSTAPIQPWIEKQECYWCSKQSQQRPSFNLGMKSKNAIDALNNHNKNRHSTLEWKARMRLML
jgi:hypothetical protein